MRYRIRIEEGEAVAIPAPGGLPAPEGAVRLGDGAIVEAPAPDVVDTGPVCGVLKEDRHPAPAIEWGGRRLAFAGLARVDGAPVAAVYGGRLEPLDG